MKLLYLVLVLLFFSCGGSLSDEQRKKIKEGMEQQKIVRVTESEIMDAALNKGRVVLSNLPQDVSPALIDSLARTQKVSIHLAVPGTENAREIEQELIEAYIEGMATGHTQENVQKIWNSPEKKDYDSLLFSKPKLIVHPDGTEELQGIWNIYMARKDLILQLSRKK
jgi:hypothetical protein